MKRKISFKTWMIISAIAVSVSIHANELLMQFGFDSGRIGKVDSTSGSEAKITFEKDFLKMEGPNFWSCRWQFNGLTVDLKEAKQTDFLEIEIAGETFDEQPFVKIMFFSPDWSKSSAWTFDISNIKKDEFTTVRAKTNLGEPAEKKDGGVALTAIGNVMFFTGAARGNQPWSLKIKSLSFSSTE